MNSRSDSMIPREYHGVRWHAFGALEQAGEVVAAVSTRHGGVSVESLASLNLSYAVADDVARVRENRRRLSDALGIEEAKVVCAEQVHGNRVIEVTESNAGAGYEDRATAMLAADGLVTDRPGLALWLGFADCVPVLAYDPVRRAVGIAHAGWRGTLGGITGELVATLGNRFGSKPTDLLVAIGPSIGPCCYTVGPEVVAAFEQAWPATGGLFSPADDRASRLDLWEANRRLFAGAGVPMAQISAACRCTACQVDEFFSHRAQRGRAGRLAAVISMRKAG